MSTITTSFLISGILLSIISKILQFFNYWQLGNSLVIIAAICFVIALLFAWPAFQQLYRARKTRHTAYLCIFATSISIISFQLLMMQLVSGQLIGILWLIPLITGVLINIRIYFRVLY
ncbi:MAG: hypothetical protein ACRDAO_04010 [Culicoidibacterales bacterium]